MSHDPVDTGMSSGSTQTSVSQEQMQVFFLARISDHPLSSFEEKMFLEYVQHSLSLSVVEKKRVLDAVPTLSQLQIDELFKVFQDEQEEFRKLMPKEGDTIRDLVEKQKKGWEQLYELYIQETQVQEKQDEDASKIEDLKKNLGI